MELNIAKYRKEKGYTQEELAEILGVTAQAVSKWETGSSLSDTALLPEIAKALNITIDMLFDRESTAIVQMVPEEKKKSINELFLRIHASTGSERVKVTLPLVFIQAIVKTGMSMNSTMNISGIDLSKIDFEQIISLVESGVVGQIVEVDTDEGEHVIIEVG